MRLIYSNLFKICDRLVSSCIQKIVFCITCNDVRYSYINKKKISRFLTYLFYEYSRTFLVDHEELLRLKTPAIIQSFWTEAWLICPCAYLFSTLYLSLNGDHNTLFCYDIIWPTITDWLLCLVISSARSRFHGLSP